MLNTFRQKLNEARKNRNELMRVAYENVIAKIIVAEKSGKYPLPLSNDVIIGLVQKEIKELEETQACFGEAKDIGIELQIFELKQYLPEPLTEEEVLNIICETISLGETNKGKVIGLTAKKVGNRFDKSKIAPLVSKALEVP